MPTKFKLPKPKFTVKMADEDHNYKLTKDSISRISGGVTNALGMIGGGKVSALKWWSSRIACESLWNQLRGEKVLTQLQVAINTGRIDIYEQHLRDALAIAYKAHTFELERTSVYGTQCHDLYEKYVLGKPVNLDATNLLAGVKDSFMRFSGWWDDFKQRWEVVATELPVGSWIYNYGGTLDLLLRDRRTDSIAVADYKNSGGMAVGHAAQVGGAYAHALAEQYDIYAHKALVIRVPKPEDGGGEVEVWDAYEGNSPRELFGLFLDSMSMRDRVADIEKTMPKRSRKKKLKAWEG